MMMWLNDSVRRGPRRSMSRSAPVLQLGFPLLWSIAIALPMLYMLLISFRTREQYSIAPLGLPNRISMNNYTDAWSGGQLGVAFVNTVVVTVVTVAGVVLFGALAAYATMRWQGKSGDRFYAAFALGLIIPFQLGLPALYKLWAQAGLTDTLTGVVLIHIGANLPFAIFLYSGFLRTVPLELEEAARVDGAGDVRTFASIVFPLLRPATATVVILTSIGVWNDLLVSIFFLQSPEKQTLPMTALTFSGNYNSNVPVIFACAVMIVLPVLIIFIALQRFFVSGLTQGALRG